MKNLKKTFTALIVTALISTPLIAQSSLVLADSSSMSITGTSTLHDWESEVTKLNADIRASLSDTNPHFSKFHLTIPVESIKSDKSKMEKKTHEALKEKDHPHITFDLISVKSVDRDTVTAQGNLTIAGETKPVTLKAGYKTTNTNSIQLQGQYTLDMTEYGVEPPSVMFGTIKAGEEVTIHYHFYLTSNNL